MFWNVINTRISYEKITPVNCTWIWPSASDCDVRRSICLFSRSTSNFSRVFSSSFLHGTNTQVNVHTLYKELETGHSLDLSHVSTYLHFDAVSRVNLSYPSVFFLHLFWKMTSGGEWRRLITGRMSFLSPNQQCQSNDPNLTEEVLLPSLRFSNNSSSSCSTHIWYFSSWSWQLIKDLLRTNWIPEWRQQT